MATTTFPHSISREVETAAFDLRGFTSGAGRLFHQFGTYVSTLPGTPPLRHAPPVRPLALARGCLTSSTTPSGAATPRLSHNRQGAHPGPTPAARPHTPPTPPGPKRTPIRGVLYIRTAPAKERKGPTRLCHTAAKALRPGNLPTPPEGSQQTPDRVPRHTQHASRTNCTHSRLPANAATPRDKTKQPAEPCSHKDSHDTPSSHKFTSAMMGRLTPPL